jgi:hypothetical protein
MPKADRDLFRRARIMSSALAGFFYTHPQSIFGFFRLWGYLVGDDPNGSWVD